VKNSLYRHARVKHLPEQVKRLIKTSFDKMQRASRGCRATLHKEWQGRMTTDGLELAATRANNGLGEAKLTALVGEAADPIEIHGLCRVTIRWRSR
jgi:hypothetical protein